MVVSMALGFCLWYILSIPSCELDDTDSMDVEGMEVSSGLESRCVNG